MCTRAFEMLRCTTVFPAVDGSNHGKRIERLSVDYSVDCDDALYSAHYVAALVLLAVAAALPAVVIIRVRALSDDSDRLRDIIGISHRVAAELGVDPDNAQEAITYLLTGREFSFMTAGLGSEYLWWEAVARRRPSASLHGVRDGQRESSLPSARAFRTCCASSPSWALARCCRRSSELQIPSCAYSWCWWLHWAGLSCRLGCSRTGFKRCALSVLATRHSPLPLLISHGATLASG